MSAPTTQKRSFSEMSEVDKAQGQRPAKVAKANQPEPETLEDARARVKQLEQTSELAKISLKTVIGALSKVPNWTMLGYLEQLVEILDGSAEGISAAAVAEACAKQHSANVKKLFNTNMAKINRVYKVVENDLGVTADDFAEAMAKCIPLIDEMLKQGPEAVVYAFDLMLEMANSVYGDLDSKGGSGYGDSEKHYQVLDARFLQIIDLRIAAEAGQESDGEWKTDSLYALVEDREFLKEYGIKGYFERSIETLQRLTGKTGRENLKRPESESGSESEG